MATKTPAPILFTADDSDDSFRAINQLADAGLPFVPVSVDGSAPVLVGERRTFHGLEGVERYIAEAKTTRARK